MEMESKKFAYENKKKAATKRSRDASEDVREIGPLPSVVDDARRGASFISFKNFCENYFPHIFNLDWSPKHISAIERIEKSINEGGKFALAMPRGEGKTSLLTVAMIWGIATGKVKHGVIVSATSEAANQILDDIKIEIEENNVLFEDFPEICYPIRKLEGIHARCRGQILNGRRTNIQFVKSGIVLPTIEGSSSSGAIVITRGILAGVRGFKKRNARPDCVLLDDPQTDLSARSPSQTATRLKIIGRGIKGLSGPGKKLAILAAVTVIDEGDLASHILDRKRYPSWHGERFQMLDSFPDNMEIWQKYADIRRSSLIETNSDEEADFVASEFYLENRDEMDKGAVATWEQRFVKGELSAIQHAMNLYFDDKAAFFAEYQNSPIVENENIHEITDKTIRSKTINTISRSCMPVECQHLTAAIDIHKQCLFYMVCGWTDHFSGHIIDYGSFPDQMSPYPFNVNDCRVTLEQTYPTIGMEGAVYAGLENLVNMLCEKRFIRADGVEFSIKQILIDRGWLPDVVSQFCRQSKHSTLILPSRGEWAGAARQWNDRRDCQRKGIHWNIPKFSPGESRFVNFDTNFWKSFFSARLFAGVGDKSTLTIHSGDHIILSDHFTAESPTLVTAKGRSVEEWRKRVGRTENHYFDVAVMNMVAASMIGIAIDPHKKVRKPTVNKKISIPEHLKNQTFSRNEVFGGIDLSGNIDFSF